jgi:hypothetical protein
MANMLFAVRFTFSVCRIVQHTANVLFVMCGKLAEPVSLGPKPQGNGRKIGKKGLLGKKFDRKRGLPYGSVGKL